jgi:hypothetical protein
MPRRSSDVGTLSLVGDYSYLRDELTLRGPADQAQVARLREQLGRQVPDDYLEFLIAHDGADGAVGVLAPVAEIGRAEDLYPELDHLRGLVVFGSDGGLEAFGFDPAGTVVVLPWIGGREDAVPQGSFAQFLRRLIEGRLLDRNG